MHTKVSRHITSRILGGFRRGHERTWFSNIIYSVPPEVVKIIVLSVCVCTQGHPCSVFDPKSSITSEYSTDLKSALEE